MELTALGNKENHSEEQFYHQLGRVVSLVGAGGKTTLLYHLAESLAEDGQKVLVTTTTHIWMPCKDYYASSLEEVEALWKKKQFAVIGTPIFQTGKLEQAESHLMEQAMSLADRVLIEADGAKGFPIKVPRRWEPVLLPQTDHVIAVMGLSALGQPLYGCCFGLEEAKVLLETDGRQVLTETDAALLLASEQGGRKEAAQKRFTVILNQCDQDASRASAESIARKLHNMGIEEVYASAFHSGEQKRYHMLAGAGSKEA